MPQVDISIDEAEEDDSPDVVVVESDNDDAVEAVVVEETIDHAERITRIEDVLTGVVATVQRHEDELSMLRIVDEVQQEEINVMAEEEVAEEIEEEQEQESEKEPEPEPKKDEPPVDREHFFFRKLFGKRG